MKTMQTRGWSARGVWLVFCLGAMGAIASWPAQESKTSGLAEDVELVETRQAVPLLKAPSAYEPKDNVLEVEISEYAGYAGLIVANGGLAPNEQSYFFKKHGFKLKLSLSEEDSWSALNSGKLAASSTTVDVLGVYGRQFKAVVPALICFSRGADGVVVRSAIRQINDLAGKTLAASQFNEAEFLIRYLAQEAGLEINLRESFADKPDPGKVNLIFCADAFGAGDLFLRDIEAGRTRLDGCVTWAPKTTEIEEKSKGKAKVLMTNRNLLIIADVLVVNKGFAEKYPQRVKGLVEGLLDGNARLRANPAEHLGVIGAAFGWDKEKARKELGKVHLANLPENQAFFSGTIDAAGSFGYIYESAAMAYGPQFVKESYDDDQFLDLKPLKAIEKEGLFAGQQADLKPIRSRDTEVTVENPLLTRNVRFLFQPNSSKLDMEDKGNQVDLEHIAKMLQVSPGSRVLLRGHVDNSNLKQFRKEGGEELVRRMALKAMQLSKDRSEEIERILVEIYKTDAGRIDTLGCGWKEPLGADMKQNRRVEVRWFMVE